MNFKLLTYITFYFLFFIFTNIKAQSTLPFTQNNYCLDLIKPVNTTFTNTQTKNLITKDLNGDGQNDVIVSNGGTAAGAINCYSFQISGTNGDFVLAKTLNVNFGASNLSEQAVNAGKLGGASGADIIFTTDSTINIYQNLGNFGFTTSTIISIPAPYKFNNHYLEVADFNGDNRDDFLFISEKTSDNGIFVSCYQQIAPFTFSLTDVHKVFGSYTGNPKGYLDVNIADIDNSLGSSANDVMFTLSSIPDSVYFLQNTTSTSTSAINKIIKKSKLNSSFSFGSSILNSELADIDNNGKVDLIFNLSSVFSNSICVYPGAGSISSYNISTITPITISTSGLKFNDFKLKDITNDGIIDFCGIGTYSFSTFPTILGVYPGNGLNSYFANPSSPLTISLTFSNSIFADEMQIADVDGRGANDILFKPRDFNIDKTYIIPNFTFTLNASPSSATLCNNPLTFNANTSTTLGNFSWINALTQATLSANNSTYTSTNTGSYYAKLKIPMYSGNNCFLKTNTVTVSSGITPSLSLTIPSPTTVCYGTIVNVIASGADIYKWVNNGTIASASATLATQAYSNTIYTLIGEDKSGCIDSTYFKINLHPQNTSSIISSTNTICLGDSVNLSFTSVKSYTWSNTIGFVSNNNSVNVTPQTNTTYSLTYEDSNACISFTNTTINVDLNCNTTGVFNGITPNNDGLNDFFYINNIENFPKNQVSIYNRWGQQVFNTYNYNNTNNYWPKKTEANQLVSSTYFFIIIYGDGKVKKDWIEVLKD